MTIDLLTAGETMAMVAPIAAESLVDAEVFRIDAGGAESNLAAHVAVAGHRARWFSRLGADPLGDRIERAVASRGVDVSSVVRDAARPTGVYVKDPGRGVHYYRAGSAASALDRGDAESLRFDGARILHLTGITAAISASAADFLDAAIDLAHTSGVEVSFDVNHRAALWDAETAGRALDALCRRADIVFVGRDEAETLWGTATASDVRARFSHVPELVVKDGEVGATAYAGDERVFVPAPVVEVVEPVGAGDAFAGGYLASRLGGGDLRARLGSGHARAKLTLQTTGDFPKEESR